MSFSPSPATPALEAVLNYASPDCARPAYFLYTPTTGAPPPPATVKHTMPIHDLRPLLPDITLDVQGFAVIDAPAMPADFHDDAAIRRDYYAACAEAVKAHTGASRVHAFDHNVRNKELAARADSDVRDPVRFAHNDYTEASAPQRVVDLFGDEAAALLTRRYQFINLWRPLLRPVADVPLAVCDARSLATSDFVATALRYADREGEVYSVRHSDGHRWYYVSQQRPDEALLLKCFDSATTGCARYTAHSAFRDPRAPADAPSRISIEVRTIAFF